MQAAAQRAASMAAALSGGASAPKAHYEAELEINDFPQHARWKVSRLHASHRSHASIEVQKREAGIHFRHCGV